jgi:hypothetical protein
MQHPFNWRVKVFLQKTDKFPTPLYPHQVRAREAFKHPQAIQFLHRQFLKLNIAKEVPA